MTREFVKYEQALALKELGFNEKCMASDYYADGKILIEYPEDGITNTEHDKLTEECNDEFDEIGEDKIEYGATIPLYQQAFRWFREEHGLNSYIYQRSNITYRGVIHKNMKIAVNYTSDSSNYEEAEQACLDKLIEIVKHEDTTR